MDSEFLSADSKSFLSVSPLVTSERFSEMTGMSIDTIRGMVEKGHLPSAKFGKRRLINLALVTQQCLSQEFENF